MWEQLNYKKIAQQKIVHNVQTIIFFLEQKKSVFIDVDGGIILSYNCPLRYFDINYTFYMSLEVIFKWRRSRDLDGQETRPPLRNNLLTELLFM